MDWGVLFWRRGDDGDAISSPNPILFKNRLAADSCAAETARCTHFGLQAPLQRSNGTLPSTATIQQCCTSPSCSGDSRSSLAGGDSSRGAHACSKAHTETTGTQQQGQ